MMPFVVFVAYCDGDNDLQTFARVYKKYDGLPTEDVFRAAKGLGKDDDVSYEDLSQWEDSLCQTYTSHVFEIPDGEILEEIPGSGWPNIFPA
jgi:hypothetical protein